MRLPDKGIGDLNLEPSRLTIEDCITHTRPFVGLSTRVGWNIQSGIGLLQAWRRCWCVAETSHAAGRRHAGGVGGYGGH